MNCEEWIKSWSEHDFDSETFFELAVVQRAFEFAAKQAAVVERGKCASLALVHADDWVSGLRAESHIEAAHQICRAIKMRGGQDERITPEYDLIRYSYEAGEAAQRKPLPCGHPMAAVIVGIERRDGEYEQRCGWCASLDAARLDEREKCRLRMLEREREVQACRDYFREADDE